MTAAILLSDIHDESASFKKKSVSNHTVYSVYSLLFIRIPLITVEQ